MVKGLKTLTVLEDGRIQVDYGNGIVDVFPKPPDEEQINEMVRRIAKLILVEVPGHFPFIDHVVLRRELENWGRRE
jgi:hypothetical protein